MKHGIYYAFWESEWEADYFRYIDKAARLGFDILEIAAGSLPDYSPEKLKDLRKAAEANNIELTVGYGPKPEQNLASPDADVRKNAAAFFTKLFGQMELLGARLIGGGLYSYWPVDYTQPFDKKEDWKHSVESIKALAPVAKECGITLCMEVLNRFEGYLLNTAEEGVRYVREVNEDNVKLMLDTFHMNIEESSMTEAIRQAGPLLGHFHTGEPNRMPPGAGRMPWFEIGLALQSIGYEGPVVMEPFVRPGGTVGQNIKIWRDLTGHALTTEELDEMAKQAVQFQKYVLEC